MPSVLTGISPSGSTVAEIKGDGSTITVASTNINFSTATTRASMHPISGTGNVNTVTLADYRFVRGTLLSVITFVHLDGTLECPGDDDIVGAIGDVVGFFKDAGGAVRIVEYTRADGTALVGGGGGGGNVATDALFDAKGDLPVGTGVNTANRLGVGTNGQALVADSTTATGLKWVAGETVAGAAIIYMADSHGFPLGLDENDGLTSLTPVRTVARALALLPKGGEVILKPGDYDDPANKLIFDVANTQRLTITGWAQTPPRIYLGEKKTVFTADSNGVWKCVITTDIPEFVATYAGVQWVWEEGTPELPITTATAHPLQKQRRQSGGTAYAMEHKRMLRVGTGVPAQIAANLTTLRTDDDASNGKWVFDATNSTLYFRRYDNEDPNTTGTGIWIPSQIEGNSLITGGTGEQRVIVQGVEVYFGYHGFDMENLTSFKLENCRAFGNAFAGCSGKQSNFSEEEFCEYAGNGTDGSDSLGPSTSLDVQISNKTKWYNIWSVGNGDQGLSSHTGSEVFVVGGLMENNGNGGLLGFGQVSCHGTSSRNNPVGGFVILGSAVIGNIQNNMLCVNCHSDGDEYGYNASSQGNGAGSAKIIVLGGSVTNATTAAFNPQADTIIEHRGVMLDGNAADTAGAGTVTALPFSLAVPGESTAQNLRVPATTLTYAASTALNLATAAGFQTLSLTGDVTLTTSGLAAGRSKTVRIIADGSTRTLTFPGGWKFIGAAAPADIAASKVGILTITSFSTTDANVVAAYSVEP